MGRRKTTHPASLLELWEVAGSTVVTTHGVYLRGFRLRGLDSEHLPANRLLASAQSLYRDLAITLPEDTVLQFILESHSDYSDIFDAYHRAGLPQHEILALQRRRRLEYLARANLRRHSCFLFVGSSVGYSKPEFRVIDRAEHDKRLVQLDELAAKASSVLESAQIECATLGERDVLELFWRPLNPGRVLEPLVRSPGRLELGGRGAFRPLGLRTLREVLVQSELRWNREYLLVGGEYHQVVTLCGLPEKTEFTDLELFYRLDFDFRMSVTVQIPSQQRFKAALDQQRRFAKADSGRGGNIVDYQRAGRMRESEELAELLAQTGQRLVLVTAQAVVPAASRAELTARVREFSDRARSKGFLFFAETAAHDREFFKTLPGGVVSSRRQLLVTSNNAVDLLPVFEEDHGDSDPVMLVQTDRGELFSFNPFEQARDNWNSTIFGASGSGKSVFVNLMIATSILASKTKGRLIVVDFAGPEKSSYLMIARLFGGRYVPVVSGEQSLNPFPAPGQALDDKGRLRGEVESFLTVLTDILLSNSGHDKDSQLFRHLIQRGVRDTYARLGAKTPVYSDLLDTLKGYSNREPDAANPRIGLAVELLDGFLKSPASRLFNRPTSTKDDAEFLVLDLYGIDSLEPHIAQAVAFLATQWVKQLAFDAADPGNKYVVLDEVAQLIRRPEMVGLLDELYSTARKHRTSVWTITQSYSTYRASVLANTIKLNSTTQIFLSHASDEAGRRQIAEDYQFTARQKHLFDLLRTVKGKYATALIRTEVADPGERDKHYLTSVLRIELSALDYQICTSDASDRELQRRFLAANPDLGAHQVLEYLAYHQPADPTDSKKTGSQRVRRTR